MSTKSIEGQIRTIRTGRTHFPVVPASSNNFTGLRAIPWIRLQGVWLEQAGFTVGQRLKVKVHRKLVVISAE
ncbi:SymE family type I addiction module toxin [Cupriavidus sp. BIC8F]|uniref:SymE family type I addiction module toxin n=1 Tax=Cupriavidus sp. BIC8F TaxID=3079014 RepID=UPI003967624D